MAHETEIGRLRQVADKRQQTANWLARLDRGSLTAEERAAFRRWLSEDPNNRQAIRDAAAFWYGLDAPLSRLLEAGPRVRHRGTALLGGLSGLFPHPRFATALAALVLFAASALLYPYVVPTAHKLGYFATTIGETRTVSLVDGSTVTLNTNTIVEQDFSRRERVIRLVSGEAVFDVAHDGKRPFLVYAADGLIRAVGTRFAVRVDSDRMSVTVTEGRIALQRRLEVADGPPRATANAGSGHAHAPAAPAPSKPALSQPMLVDKGETGAIDRAAGEEAKQAVSEAGLAEMLSWTQGRLVFYDKDLQSVVEEVARYTPVEIRIDGEELRRMKITGILPIGDVDLMLGGIEKSLRVEVVRVSPDLIYLRKG